MRIPSRIGGVKWEPVAAMIALVFVGMWLVAQPGIRLHPGGRYERVLVGEARGFIEVWPDPQTGEERMRIVMRNGHEAEVTDTQLIGLVGSEVVARLHSRPTNPVFRLFNITNWGSLIWICIGLGGQVLFAGRTLVQWFISEKERKSVVPAAFWWMSLGGGVVLFAYFVWRQDLVGVLGQCSGVVIYARNLRLIAKRKRAEGAA